jgi:hypothetical protein
MLTKQYNTAFKVIFASIPKDQGYTHTVRSALDGELYQIQAHASYMGNTLIGNMSMPTILSTLTQSSNGFAFGDGTTPPTEDDYKLSGNIISTLSLYTFSIYASEDGDTAYRAFNMTLNNTGDEPVTISEIAWFAPMRRASGSNNALCMYDRTLLPEPITIQPGAAENIVYKIGITIPSN